MKTRSIGGFNDVLPITIKRWHLVENTAQELFELYGYSEIKTPALEFTELFARSIGATTDIVEKEMYTFTDRDGSSLTLRPEGTASIVRSFIEHSMYKVSPITKFYYSGMMYRHERPQKGRYRGFYQIGAECFGSKEPYSDAELISMLWKFFADLGLTDELTLEINSIGELDSRKRYVEKLIDYYAPYIEGMCEDCRRRIKTNPLRLLDCKNDHCMQVSADAPSILDSLDDDAHEHFEDVKTGLNALDVPFVINPTIVRGLDYYTRTVFEITTDKLGAQNSVAAGGRYDGLVEQLGGPSIPAVGFALGMERVILLHETKYPEGFKPKIDIFIAHLGDDARDRAFSLANELRLLGLNVEIDYARKSLKSQMKRSDKYGAKYTFILGDEEIKNGVVKARDMAKSSEEEIELTNIKEFAKRIRT